MCGIVGYVGAWNAAPVLLSGLSRLEYRGYDSAGIAVSDLRDGENRIEILKAKGRLQALKEMTDNGKAVSAPVVSVTPAGQPTGSLQWQTLTPIVPKTNGSLWSITASSRTIRS